MTLGGLLSLLVEVGTIVAALFGICVAAHWSVDYLLRRWRWFQARREWSKLDRVSLETIVRMREDRR